MIHAPMVKAYVLVHRYIVKFNCATMSICIVHVQWIVKMRQHTQTHSLICRSSPEYCQLQS